MLPWDLRANERPRKKLHEKGQIYRQTDIAITRKNRPKGRFFENSQNKGTHQKGIKSLHLHPVGQEGHKQKVISENADGCEGGPAEYCGRFCVLLEPGHPAAGADLYIVLQSLINAVMRQ